jgi:hypothetical protein
MEKLDTLLDKDEEILWKKKEQFHFKMEIIDVIMEIIVIITLFGIGLFFSFFLFLPSVQGFVFFVFLFMAILSFLIFTIFISSLIKKYINYTWRYPRKFHLSREEMENFQEVYMLTNKRWIKRTKDVLFLYEGNNPYLTRKEHFVFLNLKDVKIIRVLEPALSSKKGLGFYTTQEVEPIDLEKIRKGERKFEMAVSFPSKKKLHDFLDIFQTVRPFAKKEERGFGYGIEHHYYLQNLNGKAAAEDKTRENTETAQTPNINFPIEITDSFRKKAILYFGLITTFILSILVISLMFGNFLPQIRNQYILLTYLIFLPLTYALLWLKVKSWFGIRKFVIGEKEIKYEAPSKFQIFKQEDLTRRFALFHGKIRELKVQIVKKKEIFSFLKVFRFRSKILVISFELENNKSKMLEISGREFHPRKFPLVLDALEKFAHKKGIDFSRKD